MKFSVIVPVYRAGQYLDRCVRSVLEQSCQDLELILVDDCCPDGCGKLCDTYTTDPRVRVIHKPVNEGLGFARNTGLETARGEYVLFLDADDHIDSRLLAQCNAAGEDILIFGTTFLYEKNGRQEVRIPQAAAAKTNQEKADIFAMLTRARIFQFAWNKLYRREFLTDCGILFEKTPLIEDHLFNIALFPRAKSVRCIPKALHFYRRPAHETLASKYSPDFFLLSKRKYTLEREYLAGADREEHSQLICHGFVKHLVSAVLRNTSPAAGHSPKVQKQALAQMLTDPVTVSAMEDYHPKNPVYQLLKSLIRRRQAGLLLAVCRIFGKIANH